MSAWMNGMSLNLFGKLTSDATLCTFTCVLFQSKSMAHASDAVNLLSHAGSIVAM